MITEIRDFAPAGPITLSRAFVLFLFHDLSRVQKPCCRRPKAKSSSVEAWSIIPDAFAAPAFKYVNNLRIRIYLGSEQIQLFIVQNTRYGRRIRQFRNRLRPGYLHDRLKLRILRWGSKGKAYRD